MELRSFRYRRGRPLKFWRKKIDALGFSAIVAAAFVGGAGFGVWTNAQWLLEEPGPWPAVLLIAALLVFSILARFFARSFLVLAKDGGRIVPYFRKPVDRSLGGPAAGGGRALAAHCERLDALAATAGLTPLSAFGYPDDFDGERITWHEAADGLRSVKGLLDVVEQVGPEHAAVRDDLVRLQGALERARDGQVPFSLILRFANDATNGMEWERRQGTIW